jgi:4-hydroxy-tetrahydrodipicolinate synthase
MSAALDRARLDTVQVVPPTPFTADGSALSLGKLPPLLQRLTAAGISVFLPGAGTGEFHSLSAQEVIELAAATRQAAPDAVVVSPIGFGLGHSLAIGRPALDAGADTLLLMPPIHPYLADAGFADYFRALTDALEIPILAYKRGPVPSDRLLLELASEGRLLGVKYAVNDPPAFLQFAEQIGDQCGLYCGTAEKWAPFFMLAGATGYTSGAGVLCPRLTLALHAALARGAQQEALDLLRVIRPIEDLRAREADSFNISLLKWSLNLVGCDFGPPRPPQRRLTPEQQEEARRVMTPILEAELLQG